MESLKISETLNEVLVSSKQDEDGNSFGGKFSGVSQSFDLGKVKCEEPVLVSVSETRCADSCKVKGVDWVGSSSNGDVSLKGISLFVELTGGMVNKPDGEKGNQSVHDVKDRLSDANRVKVDVGQHESGVNVGDLVWAIIKKQKWWPGVVCDAANAPIGPTREDDVLVKFYGNGNFIWCSPYVVRPFVGYFDQLPNQSNAKKFLDALEIAVTELGYRVKEEFTCSCYSKMKKEKTANIGDFSVTRFEPATFLERVKDLGRDSSTPQKIDSVVKQSCLSAFYRSLGHLQIPMRQLMPGECGVGESNVDDYGGVNLSKTSGQSQSQPVKKPRKKWTKKIKSVQANICSSEVLSQLQSAAQDCVFPCESKNFDSVKQFIFGFRKRAFCESSSETPVDVPNHQTQETLPKKKKVKKKKDKTVISPALGNGLNHGSPYINFQNVGSFNQNPMFSTLPDANHMQGLYQAPVFFTNNFGPAPPYFTGNHGPPQVGFVQPAIQPPTQPPLRKLEPKRPNNITENITPMPTWNADMSNTVPNANHMQGLHQAPVFFTNTFGPTPPYLTGYHGQPQVGPVPTGLTRVPKKRGRKRKNIDPQANPGPTVDLKANPGPTVDLKANPGSTMHLQPNPGSTMHLQANPGSTMHLQANSGLMTHLQANPGSTMHLQAHPGSTKHLQAHPGSTMRLQAHPGSTMHLQAHPGSTMHFQAQPGSTMHLQAYPGSTMHPQAHPGSAMDLQANPGSALDLQANPGSNANPNLNGSITGEKKQKKVKRSKEIGIPCIDLSYNKVQQDNLEVKGTAFLLKFSSEYPLPSIQDLNAVFSKFGALIESETQVWNEQLSGQVVFLDSSSAGGAFWSLQHDKPFGPVLVNYKIQHLTGSESTVPFKTPIKSPSGPKPTDSKAIVTPTMIPDLNTNSTEVQIVKRSKIIEEIRLPSNDHHPSHNKVTGRVLQLTFSPNFSLPTIQDLNMVFCKYGELNERETRVSGHEFTGQVVFVNPSTAADAIHRLDKDQPFGLALLSYKVHRSQNGQSDVRVKSPVNVSLKPPQDLGAIKKNLEMMNSMLEKNGDSLTPEMRGKLESEIKGLMKKLSGLDGSSSSSSCL